MKICLENAIGAIHGAKGACMKDGVVTAGVMAGTWTFFNDCPLILRDVKGLFFP